VISPDELMSDIILGIEKEARFQDNIILRALNLYISVISSQHGYS